LNDATIQSKLSDTKFSKEVRALEDFYKCLALDNSKAFYGFEFVEKAAEFGAIATLMVTDSLFRSEDIDLRRKYIKLVEMVKGSGSTVLVFSSLHTSGEQLQQLTGIAAILHFSMPDLEDQVQNELEAKRKAKLMGQESK
jgi:protein pelota